MLLVLFALLAFSLLLTLLFILLAGYFCADRIPEPSAGFI
jgi:hypothetical protein